MGTQSFTAVGAGAAGDRCVGLAMALEGARLLPQASALWQKGYRTAADLAGADATEMRELAAPMSPPERRRFVVCVDGDVVARRLLLANGRRTSQARPPIPSCRVQSCP